MEKVAKKESRKTRYTRTVIRDSLIELMKQRPITDITIKEICALADISRPTFYAHYRDQYDMLKNIEDETFAYFETVVFANNERKLSRREIAHLIEDVLQYIENDSNSVKVLLSENGDIGFQRKIFSRFIAYLQHVMKHYSEKTPDERKIEYYSVFMVHGIIALVHHWVKSNMNIPKNELAKMLVELIGVTGAVRP
ncbi:MAG: TetR family transcriptional regulator C-terminal domain-containing protein [Treponema sp.]|jgi:AcrR family transcriptional regulator|nr:TetR family transcriptional regulator C-terminal domain-containing protein [Treponema sp.]